jgi:hypothetical protein
MSKIISVHEYALRESAESTEFEFAGREARERGLLKLPGLEQSYLLSAIKGTRRGEYAAVWIYESREAWEGLWGPSDQPFGRGDYPGDWRIWEDEVLRPFLVEEPDKIAYTAYEELSGR